MCFEALSQIRESEQGCLAFVGTLPEYYKINQSHNYA